LRESAARLLDAPVDRDVDGRDERSDAVLEVVLVPPIRDEDCAKERQVSGGGASVERERETTHGSSG